jgi:hypothetical protein
MKKTMAFRLLPDIHIAVNSADDPSDEEWQAYTSAVIAKLDRGYDIARMRTLVVSDGGGPNAAQRKIVNTSLAGRPTRVALVSSSVAIRSITTALGWFNSQIKSFSPGDVTSAFRFLDIPESDYAWIWSEVQSLATELPGKHVKSVIGGMAVAPGKHRAAS